MSPEAINKAIELATGGIRNGVTDLNAMHEAEKRIPVYRHSEYTAMLDDVTDNEPIDDWLFAHATAAQRAEAFLRTIGKWEDG